jgi:hypothetical protein
VDIDIKKVCPKCRMDHEAMEKSTGVVSEITKDELCLDCKRLLGLKPAKGARKMKRGRKAVKAPKLDKETKGFIKSILRSGKKAEKLEAKAEKYELRADELREKAEAMRARIDALKEAVENC